MREVYSGLSAVKSVCLRLHITNPITAGIATGMKGENLRIHLIAADMNKLKVHDGSWKDLSCEPYVKQFSFNTEGVEVFAIYTNTEYALSPHNKEFAMKNTSPYLEPNIPDPRGRVIRHPCRRCGDAEQVADPPMEYIGLCEYCIEELEAAELARQDEIDQAEEDAKNSPEGYDE